MSTHDEKEAAMLQWRKLVQTDKKELGDFPRFTVHPLVVTEDEKRNLFRMCIQSAEDRDRISKISVRYEEYKKPSIDGLLWHGIIGNNGSSPVAAMRWKVLSTASMIPKTMCRLICLRMPAY